MQATGPTETARLLNFSDIKTGNSQEEQLRELTENLNSLLENPTRSDAWFLRAHLFQNRVHTCLAKFKETANKTNSVSQECLKMIHELEEGLKNLSRVIKKLNSVSCRDFLCPCACFLLLTIFTVPFILAAKDIG